MSLGPSGGGRHLPHLSYPRHIQTFHLLCCDVPIIKVENMSFLLELQLALLAVGCWPSLKNQKVIVCISIIATGPLQPGHRLQSQIVDCDCIPVLVQPYRFLELPFLFLDHIFSYSLTDASPLLVVLWRCLSYH